MGGITEKIAEASCIAENIVLRAVDMIVPGMRVCHIDRCVAIWVQEQGALPTTRIIGVPGALSLSVNDGVLFCEQNSSRVLEEGDLVKVDLGMCRHGVFTDLGVSVPVGKPSEEVSRLLCGTASAMNAGLDALQNGVNVGYVSQCIERELCRWGLSPVDHVYGHGIGTSAHEEPVIPSTVTAPFVDYTRCLRAGMTICIEPHATTGSGQVLRTRGGGLRTRDRRLAAFCEIPVAICEHDVCVLANRIKEYIDDVYRTVPSSA